MVDRAVIIGLSAIAASLALANMARPKGPLSVNSGDFSAPDLLRLAVDIPNTINLAANTVNTQGKARLTAGETRALIASIDHAYFGAEFSRSVMSYGTIVGLFKHESSLRPGAINMRGRDGLFGGAWGIGQVLATTATDYGIGEPDRLLDASTGARVAMQHLQFTRMFLEERTGHSLTLNEWLGAYNIGVGNFLKGNRGLSYALAVRARSII